MENRASKDTEAGEEEEEEGADAMTPGEGGAAPLAGAGWGEGVSEGAC